MHNDILKQRQKTHGNFTDVAYISQTIKLAMRSGPQWKSMNPAQQEALGMIAVKLARCVCGDATEPDHMNDVIGYSRLYLAHTEEK